MSQSELLVRIQKALKEDKDSMHTISDKIGIGKTMLERIRDGQVDPALSVAERLIRYYGIIKFAPPAHKGPVSH